MLKFDLIFISQPTYRKAETISHENNRINCCAVLYVTTFSHFFINLETAELNYYSTYKLIGLGQMVLNLSDSHVNMYILFCCILSLFYDRAKPFGLFLFQSVSSSLTYKTACCLSRAVDTCV